MECVWTPFSSQTSKKMSKIFLLKMVGEFAFVAALHKALHQHYSTLDSGMKS